MTKTLSRDAEIDTQRFVDLLAANVLNKKLLITGQPHSDDDNDSAENNNVDSDSNDSFHR